MSKTKFLLVLPSVPTTSFPMSVNDSLILPVAQDEILANILFSLFINHQQILLVFLQGSMKNSFWNLCHHFLSPPLLASLYKPQSSPIWIITTASYLVSLLCPCPPTICSQTSSQQIVSKPRSGHINPLLIIKIDITLIIPHVDMFPWIGCYKKGMSPCQYFPPNS